MLLSDWANGGSADVGFSKMGTGAFLGNGCGVEEQNHVALLQGSETAARLCYRSWILCI